MNQHIRFLQIALPALLLACTCGCATSNGGNASIPEPSAASIATPPEAPAYRRVERAQPPCDPGEAAFECDRRAILAMVGEYRVSFAFDETVELAPGYTRREPMRSDGFETVVLVEDAGNRIVLQHLLVDPKSGHVTKHWRQDWVYQPTQHFGFEGEQRFPARERTAAETEGAWAQLVYEVSDAPRYAGIGRFNHRYGVSTWTSERTWRPLPRREYTKRDDYHLLNVENRHTITPHGFTHEQDNTKVQRRAGERDRTLVREYGFNDYVRIEGFDFGPAYRYWQQTAPFWAAIRAKWSKHLDRGLTLNYPTGDEKLIMAVLMEAEAFRNHQDVDRSMTTLAPRFAAMVSALPAQTAGR